MVALAAAIDLIIAFGYLSFAFLIVPLVAYKMFRWERVVGMGKWVKLGLAAALFATFVFFLGCSGTHFEHVSHYSEFPAYAEHAAPHMVAVGLPQALGVWGPLLLAGLLNRELSKVKVEKE